MGLLWELNERCKAAIYTIYTYRYHDVWYLGYSYFMIWVYKCFCLFLVLKAHYRKIIYFSELVRGFYLFLYLSLPTSVIKPTTLIMSDTTVTQFLIKVPIMVPTILLQYGHQCISWKTLWYLWYLICCPVLAYEIYAVLSELNNPTPSGYEHTFTQHMLCVAVKGTFSDFNVTNFIPAV